MIVIGKPTTPQPFIIVKSLHVEEVRYDCC